MHLSCPLRSFRPVGVAELVIAFIPVALDTPKPFTLSLHFFFQYNDVVLHTEMSLSITFKITMKNYKIQIWHLESTDIKSASFLKKNNTLSINCPVNSEKNGDCVEKLPQFLPANYEPHYAHELPLVIKAWREASMKSQQMLKSSNVNRSIVIYSTTFTFFMRNKIQIWTSFLIKHLYSFKIK